MRALEEATYRIERMNNELIIARREAEEARALKARLAATVSHELRGPLNLILGFSKLMALVFQGLLQHQHIRRLVGAF